MLTTHNKLQKINSYYAKMGWVDESVILNNLVVILESSVQENDMLELFATHDSIKSKNLFFKFKRLTTDSKNNFNELRLENAWQAFDSANGAA